MKKINLTALIVLILLIAGCSRSPNALNQPAGPTGAKGIASVDVVKATPEAVEIQAGAAADALVKLNIQNGYHVNANPPSYPYLKATELEITPSGGVSVAFISYPNALTKTFAFAEKPLAVYEGETILKANLKADKSAKLGQHNIAAKLRVQACDDQVCYAPGTIDLVIPVNIK